MTTSASVRKLLVDLLNPFLVRLLEVFDPVPDRTNGKPGAPSSVQFPGPTVKAGQRCGEQLPCSRKPDISWLQGVSAELTCRAPEGDRHVEFCTRGGGSIGP